MNPLANIETRALFAPALLLAVLVVFAVHALDFTGSVANFVRLSGGGVLLDVTPSFSEDAIYRRIADYGEEGRTNYVFRNLTVDVLLPLAVFPALFLSMRRAVKGVSIGHLSRSFLYSLPFVYVVFDLLENGAVLVLLAYFPDRIPIVAAILPYLTVVKRAASLLAIAVPLLMFSVAAVRRRLRSKPRSPASAT